MPGCADPLGKRQGALEAQQDLLEPHDVKPRGLCFRILALELLRHGLAHTLPKACNSGSSVIAGSRDDRASRR